LSWSELGISLIESNLNYRIGAGGHLYTRLREVEGFGKVDIVVLGSSHAYRSFDPRIFKSKGYKLFNLGSSAQTPIQSELLLNRYLNELNPSLVILEVFPNSIISDGVEASLDLISNSKSNDLTTFKLFLESKNIKILNTFIVAKIHELLGLKIDFSEPLVKENDRYIKGGYVENLCLNTGNCQIQEMSTSVNKLQLQSLIRIEQLLEKKGINLLYVTAPVTKKYFDLHPGYPVFYEHFKCKKNYYDFTIFNNLNDNLHFKDCDHLNQNGTSLFNEMLFSQTEILNQ
jgi:hypothetical protein